MAGLKRSIIKRQLAHIMYKCPLCANTAISKLEDRGKYSILFCNQCNLRFSEPMKEGGKEFYHSRSYQVKSPEKDWRYKLLFSLVNIDKSQKVLDIGCGRGDFLLLVKEKGAKLFGIDIDKEAIILAKNRLKVTEIKVLSWDNLGEDGMWKGFDLITSFDILEHVSSPIRFLNTVKTILNPGGLICITVPRWDRDPKVFDSEVDYPPHHLTIWTSNALKIALKKSGFRDIKIIEKPLMGEDLLLHTVFAVKKIRRLKSKGSFKLISAGSGNFGVIRAAVIFLLTIIFNVIVLFLRLIGVGRGHTILAIAKK